MKIDCGAKGLLAGALVWFLGCHSSRANVYATDIQINGSTNNAAIVATNGLQISYILNEPATLGVTVQIESNSAVLWTNYLAWPAPGTLAGSNSVIWDGTDQTTGTNAAAGVYSISITAEAAGYANWTNTTDDSASFRVPFPMSIAVNKNTNSPFYGRVFVGSAPWANLGSAGVEKFNADGSLPEEGGGLCTGGYAWAGNLSSPWKIALSGDDKVYIEDWSEGGVVLAFDETISTNYLTVLGANNYAWPFQSLSGPCVTGAATNTELFMADASPYFNDGTSLGILSWGVTNNGKTGTHDTGTVAVAISTDTNGLTVAPWDMCLDTNGNIYAIQSLDGWANTNYAATMRVFCFTNFAGSPETNAWSVWSTNEDLENAYGIAVDPTATFVAVAVLGYEEEPNYLLNGGVSVYYATNGQLVTQLDVTNGLDSPSLPWCSDVAWDNAGNLYATDCHNGVWRVYSPPGTNQATTVAAAVVQVYDTLAPPSLCSPRAGREKFRFTLMGQSNVTYVIQASPDLVNWTNIATNYDTSAVRTIRLPVSAGPSFYQAVIP